jgi:hypothetical protein
MLHQKLIDPINQHIKAIDQQQVGLIQLSLF